MDLEVILRDRRAMAAAGAGAVLLLGVLGIGLGVMMRGHGHPAKPAAAPVSEQPHSLQVELGHEDPGLDPQRPLRCFAGGQYVGELTLKQCAEKNGVQAGSLDVGLDTSGQLAAAGSDAPAVLQPLPGAPTPPQPAAGAAAPAAPAEAAHAAPGPCWRYDGDWRKVSEGMTLDACVQALFAGRCQRPGAADYGRWGGDTLRLVVGRVELSADNKTFRTLVKQPPGDCAIPHLTE
jgi:hypothetical protein